MARLALSIDNMHCGACIRRVTQTLNGLEGTHAESVSLGKAQVSSEASNAQILEALGSAGFPARVIPGGS